MFYDVTIVLLYNKEEISKRVASEKTTKIFLLSQKNRTIIQFGFAEIYATLVIQTIKDKNVRGTPKKIPRGTQVENHFSGEYAPDWRQFLIIITNRPSPEMPGGLKENFLFILLPPLFPIANKQKFFC